MSPEPGEAPPGAPAPFGEYLPPAEPSPSRPGPAAPPRYATPRRPVAGPRQWALSLLLLVATFFTATTIGVDAVLAARTEVISPIPQVPFVGALLSPRVVRMVWSDPALLRVGLAFSLPMMFVLLSHELGHYLLCRRYRIAATPPYFLPAPFAIGTFGAFIRIRSPIRNRRELFDVGIAGPIAGFVVLLPLLVYGIAHSQPTRVVPATPDGPVTLLLQPGASLLTSLVSWLVHGPLPEATVLNPHPFVLASWVGLLATSLNLIPLSQLDGGHILYATLGRRQWRLATPLWLALVAAGFLFPGWWVWALVVRVIGLRHPPVAEEAAELGAGRRALALFALLILVLCFMPVPLETTILSP
jgi:membrane-associated protease RseP (regulator of RpoE activity)